MYSGAEAQRLILRGGRSAAAGFAVRLGARLLFLFAAARLFGAALFGAYSLAIAAVELLVTISGLGMKRILFKFLDEDGSERPPVHVVLDAAILVTAAGMLLAGTAIFIVLLIPGSLVSGNTATAFIFVAPMIIGQALLDLALAATRWKHRMHYEVASRSIVEPYAGLAAAVAAFLAGYRETGLLIGYWTGTLAALAYAILGIRRCYGAFGLGHYRLLPSRLAAMLQAASATTLSEFISGLLARLDLYLVGILLGESPAGIYGMARQVRTPIRQVRQSFDGLLTPLIAKVLAVRGTRETGTATASASRLILALQLPILITLIVIGQPLLHWFGPIFVIGYWAMVILALAETVQGAFGITELIFLYRRPAIALQITAAGIAVTLATGWMLIPPLGIDGAALAVLSGVVAAALIRRLALKASFGIAIPARYSAGPVAAALLAIAGGIGVAALLRPGPDLLVDGLSLIAGLAIYAATLKAWLMAAGDSLSLRNFGME